MSDLIDRKELIDMLITREAYCKGVNGDLGGAISGVIKLIECAPSAERTGTWIGEWDAYDWDGEPIVDIWRCSVCDKVFDEWEDKPDWKYCPNCGARLEDPEDEVEEE